jgi:acyl carrier protein
MKGQDLATASEARAVIERFLDRINKPYDGLTDDTQLYGEGLGLDSLETAELSAMFEDELGADPFSAGGSLPQTVGEVLAFYEATSTV